jgi:hypothetical protein
MIADSRKHTQSQDRTDKTQIVHLLCMKYGYNHYTPMVESFFVSQLSLHLPLLSQSNVFLFIFIVLNCTN